MIGISPKIRNNLKLYPICNRKPQHIRKIAGAYRSPGLFFSLIQIIKVNVQPPIRSYLTMETGRTGDGRSDRHDLDLLLLHMGVDLCNELVSEFLDLFFRALDVIL